MLLDAIGTEDAQGGFYAVPMVGGGAVKISDHSFSRRGDPDRDREPTPEDVRAVTGTCRGRLRDFEAYRVLEARTCFYSVTADERFIAEPVERAWMLAGFSGHGFKFGASLGLAAAEAVAGVRGADEFRAYAAGLGAG